MFLLNNYVFMQKNNPSESSVTLQEKNEIVVELSDEGRLKQEIIESLLEPGDRATYGQRQREAAAKLGKSVRTVRRLVKQWEEQGLAALAQTTRTDKGKHRIDEDWQKFIIKTYKEGNKGSKRITPKQVAIRVKAKAAELGQDTYPSDRTVYRVLQLIIEKQEQTQNVRNRGWHGSRLSLKTRTGENLAVEYSNHVWQCDHTLADILLVGQDGRLLGRPWLTTVIDSYSRCIVGINLGYDAPSSQVVALALRHAILPKSYSPEYNLYYEWGTYGQPEHFYTDGGKDFCSNHLQQIGVQLGFVCHLRDRPSEGGIVERPFGTFNTKIFSTLSGYTGSNVQRRPEEAEKEACHTLRDLEQKLVYFIVNQYNQDIDTRMGNQTRFERWKAGLIAVPNLLSERDLDICLMKQTRRSIYRGGYVQFENLTYRGEHLAGYAGENVVLRYDPRDITTILIYSREGAQEVFLARAYAQDLETEQLSLDEAKASSRKIREAGRAISNRSILAEVRDRDVFLPQNKKSRKERQKIEQAGVRIYRQPVATEPEELEAAPMETEPEMPEIFNYKQLKEDHGL